MRHPARVWVAATAAALIGTAAFGQATKTTPPPASKAAKAEAAPTQRKGGRTAASPTYRTLTGTVAEIESGGELLTINLAGGDAGEAPKDEPAKGKGAAKKAAGGQAWRLATGRQTLLLRAGRNGQYSEITAADLKAGDAVQAVVELRADPDDRSHATWWLVVFPPGTTPPAR